MTQADSVHSTPRINTSSPELPPSIELQVDLHPHWGPFDAVAAAIRAGHPLANLLRLRQEAADEVERLLAFLDETEGDPDIEAGGEPTDAEICEAAGRVCDHHEDDEDGADSEPEETDDDMIRESSLGWPERDSQRIWPDAAGDHCDRTGALA